MARHLLEFEVELSAVLDLTDSGAQVAVGLTEADLKGDDLTRSQAIGEAAHHLGREGVRALCCDRGEHRAFSWTASSQSRLICNPQLIGP